MWFSYFSFSLTVCSMVLNARSTNGQFQTNSFPFSTYQFPAGPRFLPPTPSPASSWASWEDETWSSNDKSPSRYSYRSLIPNQLSSSQYTNDGSPNTYSYRSHNPTQLSFSQYTNDGSPSIYSYNSDSVPPRNNFDKFFSFSIPSLNRFSHFDQSNDIENKFSVQSNRIPYKQPTRLPSENPQIFWANVPAEDEDKYMPERATGFKQTKKFVNAVLDAHNGYRRKHKVADFKYNQEIAKFAQNWANKLIGSIASGGHLRHRPNNKYGENLWMGSGYKFTDEQAVTFAVKQWYDEIRHYKRYFNREPDMESFSSWGHFTQCIWKNTARVGVGIARKKGYIVVVANYDTPGNVIGQFAKNVRKS